MSGGNMTSKERLITALNFEEPDRVPIELMISPAAKKFPEAKRIIEFIEHEADNFLWVPGVDWGFCGLSHNYTEEKIGEDERYIRIKRTQKTPAGDFTAITRHNKDELNASDYHWEKRYISSLDDLSRLAEAPRPILPIDSDGYQKGVTEVGDRGIPLVGLFHPLGWLTRNATMEEVYIWFRSETELVHKYLKNITEQMIQTIKAMGKQGMNPFFQVTAHEMLIPPWMGPDQWDELIHPYDKQVNTTIHNIGGKLRVHCHGNSGQYLEKFADLGTDNIEPLESPPFGDVDLAEAKRLVGNQIMLSGNIPSNLFLEMSVQDVKESVREAVKKAAPGGGFALRTTGGHAGTNSTKDRAQMLEFFTKIEAYIDAALKYGQYPISG
jgi:uroporphyrinogen-III decarboxylase